MITVEEFLMGREKEYPLTLTQAMNMARLLAAVNCMRGMINIPMKVNSGYRPGRYNTEAKGAKDSPHLMCQAIDFADPGGVLADWCMHNLSFLEVFGLYMEDARYTPGWCHLQIREPLSGNRVFIPYARVAQRVLKPAA